MLGALEWRRQNKIKFNLSTTRALRAWKVLLKEFGIRGPYVSICPNSLGCTSCFWSGRIINSTRFTCKSGLVWIDHSVSVVRERLHCEVRLRKGISMIDSTEQKSWARTDIHMPWWAAASPVHSVPSISHKSSWIRSRLEIAPLRRGMNLPGLGDLSHAASSNLKSPNSLCWNPCF